MSEWSVTGKPSRREMLKLGIIAASAMAFPGWTVSPQQESSSDYPTYTETDSRTRHTTDLDGTWQFQLDPQNRGIAERWFSQAHSFRDKAIVPGAWQAEGFGQAYEQSRKDPNVTELAGPQTQFLGTGWYKRAVSVPRIWKKQRVWLKVGAVNPSAEFWVNGTRVGAATQPGIPTRFDITEQINSGQINDVTVRVYEENRGLGNWYNLIAWWSGLWRSVKLQITRESWIHDVRALPDLDRSSALIRADIRGAVPANAVLHVSIGDSNQITRRVPGEGTFSFKVPIANPRPWSPEDPYLYVIRLSLVGGEEQLDDAAVRFGLRKFEARDNRLFLNNRPILFRCYGDDGMYPVALHPETRPDVLRKRLEAAKSIGFNAAYPCAFAPPDEFLDAADEVGMLVQFDIPAVLALQRHGPGDLPRGSAEQHQAVLEQWLASLQWTQNHPSVVIYAAASEVYPDNPYVQELYQLSRRLDPTRLVMSWSGLRGATDLADVGTLFEPMDPSEQLHLQMDGDAWRDPRGIPGIAHEFAAAESLVDPQQIDSYGHGLIPVIENDIAEAAQRTGVSKLLPSFIENSRKLAAACRRVQIEECRKVSDLAGYKVWLIDDIPGYPQGIFDPFGQPKLATAGSLVRSNAESVLLMNERSNRTRRTFRSGETAEFDIFVSHYGSRPLDNCTLRWAITSTDGVLASGEMSQPNVPPFTTRKLIGLRVVIPPVHRPESTSFSVSLQSGSAVIENSWICWLFPEAQLPRADIVLYRRDEGWGIARSELPLNYREWDGKPADLLITGVVDELVTGFLEQGGKVLLLLEGADSMLRSKALVHTQFMPRWPLTNGRDISSTLIEKHPALGDFPHEGFCDYQFYNLIVFPPAALLTHPLTIQRPEYSRGLGVAINIDKLSPSISPLIHVFGLNEKRAYLCEAAVGKGRMLATSLRFRQAAQFPEGAWLLAQFVQYTQSDAFRPAVTLSREDLVHWKERQA